ncbi:MAG TPA: hypothetical protein VLE99_06020 [Candidatus Saccharimonadales bacterium]|nr:hypothetical protein [Candidatus Saccharimonadales bacterium]
MVKKIARYALIAFLVFFIAYKPQSAAAICRGVADVVVDVAKGFGDVISILVP